MTESKFPTKEQMLIAAEFLEYVVSHFPASGRDGDCLAVVEWLKSGPKLDRREEMLVLIRQLNPENTPFVSSSAGDYSYAAKENWGTCINDVVIFGDTPDELRDKLLAMIAKKNSPPTVDGIPADQIADTFTKEGYK